MHELSLNKGGHKWRKVNEDPKIGRGGLYNDYTCTGCKIHGKSYENDQINISETYTFDQVFSCNAVKSGRPTLIKLVENVAIDKCFGLTAGRKLHVIDCPNEFIHRFKNDVWVKSDKSEPIRLFDEEFEVIS